MSNSVFDLDEPFDFKILNLGNPTLVNNNNYSSKITHGLTNKNLYIQLPKCSTKQGIHKNTSKTYTELSFSIADKNVIEFFENLEKTCTDKIFQNRDLWFYDSKNMDRSDIDDLMLSTMKPYKHGKQFLVKAHIKLDKFNIYDENENKIPIDEFDNSNEFIPLVNINNIKFSTKNFCIEIFLTQIMLITPADEFEKQVLIKVQKDKPLDNKTLETTKYNNNLQNVLENTNDCISISELTEKTDLVEETDLVENKDLDENTNIVENSDIVENYNLDKNSGLVNKSENKNTKTNHESLEIKNKSNTDNNDFKYLINNDLETIDILDITENTENTENSQNNENNSINLKSHEEIYLEIYKTAIKKAKDIRKNAIAAFLDAKKIKDKYELDTLDIDSSDDEKDFLNFDY